MISCRRCLHFFAHLFVGFELKESKNFAKSGTLALSQSAATRPQRIEFDWIPEIGAKFGYRKSCYFATFKPSRDATAALPDRKSEFLKIAPDSVRVSRIETCRLSRDATAAHWIWISEIGAKLCYSRPWYFATSKPNRDATATLSDRKSEFLKLALNSATVSHFETCR